MGGSRAAGARHAPLALVAALFLLSGATGLVYEVIWLRGLTLVFGKTVHAAGAVLAAFMGGLALGSLLCGRALDARDAGLRAARTVRHMRPLAIYAMLEVGIGVWALLLPFVMKLIGIVYVAAARGLESPPAAEILRFALATVALVPATALMGATFPALSRWAVRRRDQAGSRLGLLYGLNTIGGVAGCLAAGFFLLETLGLGVTLLVSAAGNFLVAGLALLLARRSREKATEVPATPSGGVAQRAVVEAGHGGSLPLVMAAVALSGFGALALEVIWTRVLQMVFGSSTYSFSAMLSVFLFGIGAGSLILTPLADRLKRPWIVLGSLIGGIGIFVLASAHAVDRLPGIYLRFISAWGQTWGHEMELRFMLSAALMLPATLLSGAVWPVAVRIVRPGGDTISGDAGRLYAASTVGSILGSLAGAFVLLPALGMQYGMAAVGILMAALGAALVLYAPAPKVTRRVIHALCLVLAAGGLSLTLAPWDRKVITSGTYYMPEAYLDAAGRPALEERLKEMRLVYYAEGVTLTPSVMILGDVNKAFFNDGKIEGATALDGLRLQRMLGHLGFLLHSGEPRSAFNVGLGSGITVGAMGAHPVDRIDCAEIEPMVAGAARQFDSENFAILDHPALRMIYNDGRNHLMLSRDAYDVVSSEPSHPLVGSVASLYTVDYFRLARSRLAPGGLVVQYLPLYQLSHADYLGIMRTFAAVFPQATVWFMGVDTVMVGGAEPQRIPFERLAARMTDPKVAASLREIGLDDPARLLATFCFTLQDVAADLAAAPINTDDLPDVEFSAPRSQLINTVRENLPWLLARKRSPMPLLDLPESWPADDPRRGTVLNRLENALRVQRLEMQGRLQVLQGDLEGGIATLQQAISTDPADIYARDLAARNLVKLGGRLHAQGRGEEAVAAYEESLKWDPRHFLALYNLARLEYDRGRPARALDLTRQALDLAPHSPSLNYRMGLLLFQKGAPERAEQFLKAAADLDPRYPEPLMVLGDIFRGRRQPDRAADLYRRAIEVGKEDAEAHAALAQALIDQGRNDDASAHLDAAAREAPRDPEVIFTRARLMLAKGRTDDARRDLQEALQVGGEPYRRRAASDPILSKLLE